MTGARCSEGLRPPRYWPGLACRWGCHVPPLRVGRSHLSVEGYVTSDPALGPDPRSGMMSR